VTGAKINPAPQAEETLDHPVWVQIVDLCQVLREEPFLKLIGAQIGHVISIDNSEAYRSKLFGPRIRLLVQDLQQLPQTVVIPRLDGEGTIEYNLEYSGLPRQCGRCRGHDHLVRNCPKKHPVAGKKEVHSKNKIAEKRGEYGEVPNSGEALGDSKVNQKSSSPTKEPEQEPIQKTHPDSTQKEGDDAPSANSGMQETSSPPEVLIQVPGNTSGDGCDQHQ
jgi:hypothetical protein